MSTSRRSGPKSAPVSAPPGPEPQTFFQQIVGYFRQPQPATDQALQPVELQVPEEMVQKEIEQSKSFWDSAVDLFVSLLSGIVGFVRGVCVAIYMAIKWVFKKIFGSGVLGFELLLGVIVLAIICVVLYLIINPYWPKITAFWYSIFPPNEPSLWEKIYKFFYYLTYNPNQAQTTTQ